MSLPADPLVADPLVPIQYRTAHVVHPEQINYKHGLVGLEPYLASVVPSVLLSFQYKRLPDSGLKKSPSFGNMVNPPDETSER